MSMRLYESNDIKDVANSIRNKFGYTGANMLFTEPDGWEQGTINADGSEGESTTRIRSKKIEIDNPSDDYYISVEGTDYCILNIMLFNSNNVFLQQYYNINKNINGTKSLKLSFSSQPTTKYIRILLRNVTTTKVININEISLIKPMLIKGGSKIPFEPYSKYKLNEMASQITNIPTSPDGTPFEFSGFNAELIDSYSETWALADTSFEIGSSSSTNATNIKSSTNNKYSSGQLAIGDKDIIVVQSTRAKPVHSSSATKKAYQESFVSYNVSFFANRKTSSSVETTTRQLTTISFNSIEYYNSSGVMARYGGTYGLYATIQNPTLSGTTTPYVYVSSPNTYYRASSTYESTTNIKLVTDCTFEWELKIYEVDNQTSLGGVINKKIDELMVKN